MNEKFCYICEKKIKLDGVYICQDKWRHDDCAPGSDKWKKSSVGKTSNYKIYFEEKDTETKEVKLSKQEDKKIEHQKEVKSKISQMFTKK
jgi:hypothetical protein